MKIKYKLLLFVGFFILLMASLSAWSLYQLKTNLYSQKQTELKHLTQLALSEIQTLHARAKNGSMTEQQAQQAAIETIKSLRYGDNDYFWINDRKPTMIMHPTNPKLDGKPLDQIKDPNGVYLFMEFVKVVNDSGSGYVGYAWPKPGSEAPQPKISYIEHYAPWDWIIGTGVYVDDLEAIFFEQVMQSLTVIVLALLVLGVISWRVTRAITQPIHQLQRVLHQVESQGDFSLRLPSSKTQDELAIMSHAVNELLNAIETAINEANRVVGAIAQGDFEQRIHSDLKGHLNQLKQGVNGSAESVHFTMTELERVMQALYQGDFSVRMDDKVAGDLRQQVEQAMQSMEQTIGEIIRVMDKMQAGKFQHRVDTEARGDLLELKNGINASMDSLERAIHDITSIVVAQSHGDLTNKINADYHGELRVLKEAVNSTADKLIEVVSQAVQSSNIVSSAANEVSDGSSSLSQRVQEQAAALEETSSTMDEMSAAVQHNTENAQHAAKLSQDVQAKAAKGVAVMKNTINAIEAIQQSSHKINEIVTLIDGIAFQTNLLALNAAVEAARAGEHGRGFAVVAGEVRSLAQKSAEAAKDIKTLITESVDRVEQGTQLVSQSGETLEDINNAIGEMSGMIHQIAKASAEQTDGIRQVHHAIAQIDGVTQQNAALVEETSAASESLSEQARVLQSEMAFFNTQKSLTHH